MSRILVEVFCPATSKKYDFWVPKRMRVGTAIQKLCEDIRLYEGNDTLFANISSVLLVSSLIGAVLPRSDSLEACGVKGGDKLTVV